LFRVVGAVPDTSGGVVVAVNGSQQLIYLTPSYDASIVVGRQGEGPGEFRAISKVSRDSEGGVAVWDALNRRATLFDPAGQFSTIVSFQSAGPQEMVGTVSDGGERLLVTAVSSLALGHTNGEGKSFIIWDLTGQRVDEFLGPPELSYPGIYSLIFERNGTEARRSSDIYRGCLPSVMSATIGNEILVADGSSGELYAYALNGSRRLLHKGEGRPDLSQSAYDHIVQMIDEAVQMESEPRTLPGPGGMTTIGPGRLVEQSRIELMERIGEIGAPIASMWTHMFVDTADRIWLRRSTCYDEESETVWDLLDSDGVPSTEIIVPTGVQLLSADENRVFALEIDDQGVEHLTTYEFSADVR
jgi:hypothetical protein